MRFPATPQRALALAYDSVRKFPAPATRLRRAIDRIEPETRMRHRPTGPVAALLPALLSIPLATLSAAVQAAPGSGMPAHQGCEGLGDPSFFRDEGINMKVATKLRFNKALIRESIQTKTNGGIVSLSGYVSTAEHARLAAKLASDVGGVRCVNNFLVVGAPPPQPPGSY